MPRFVRPAQGVVAAGAARLENVPFRLQQVLESQVRR